MAAVITTLSFIPQVLQTIRTRDTSGISLPMYSLFVCGISLWLIYGIMIRDIPIILANFSTMALASIILIYKIREVRGKRTKSSQ